MGVFCCGTPCLDVGICIKEGRQAIVGNLQDKPAVYHAVGALQTPMNFKVVVLMDVDHALSEKESQI